MHSPKLLRSRLFGHSLARLAQLARKVPSPSSHLFVAIKNGLPFCLFSSFALVACGKSIDPAYLKAHKERADGVCACVAAQPKLPTKTLDGAEVYDREPAKEILEATGKCILKFPGEMQIKNPNGTSDGIYEESLKESDRVQLTAEVERYRTCKEVHYQQRRDVF